MLLLALVSVAISGVHSAFPNITVCKEMEWDLGDAPDPDAPTGPIPVPGQQVYIQDAINFCLNLPNPNSTMLVSVKLF
ncbi:hypothetical protein HDU98_011759 [Podochytrium sp. JEL0797]|nr:hypothetical protein HDU98_011759 [Podochytrium sp. JEL0797]